jgi:hypothetical protein
MMMRTLLSALIALPVLGGVVTSASAKKYEDDFPRNFWEQQQKQIPG